jgi:multidrug resistance efflux pump
MGQTMRWSWTRWLLAGAVLAAGLAAGGASLRNSSVGNEPAGGGSEEAEAVACFGHVDVEHGVTSLYPVQAGRVADVLVEENQRVEAGALLLRLEDSAARLRVKEAEADLAAARLQLVRSRKLPGQHEARLAQMQAGIEAAESRLSVARRLRDRQASLLTQDVASARDLAIATDQVKEAQALLRTEREKRAELQLHDPADEVRGAEAAVQGREARLGQAREILRECGLRAPSGGKVLRVLVGPGELLGGPTSQPVLLFCPDGPRFIRAEVEQEFARRVQVGQPATIRDESDDATVWRGRVSLLSDWFTQRRSVLREPLQGNDVRTLECRIVLEPGQPPLRIGQRVRVLIGTKPS